MKPTLCRGGVVRTVQFFAYNNNNRIIAYCYIVPIVCICIIIFVIAVVCLPAKVNGQNNTCTCQVCPIYIRTYIPMYIYLQKLYIILYSYDEFVPAGAVRYSFSRIFIVDTRLRYLISLLIFFFIPAQAVHPVYKPCTHEPCIRNNIYIYMDYYI